MGPIIATIFTVIAIAISSFVVTNPNINFDNRSRASSCNCVGGHLTGNCGASLGMGCSANIITPTTIKVDPNVGIAPTAPYYPPTASPTKKTTKKTSTVTVSPTQPLCNCVGGHLTGNCGASLGMGCSANITPTPTSTPPKITVTQKCIKPNGVLNDRVCNNAGGYNYCAQDGHWYSKKCGTDETCVSGQCVSSASNGEDHCEGKNAVRYDSKGKVSVTPCSISCREDSWSGAKAHVSCIDELTYSCTKDTSCPGGTRLRGQAISNGTSSDAVNQCCGAQESCDSKQGKCVAMTKKALGAVCGTDSECISGHCWARNTYSASQDIRTSLVGEQVTSGAKACQANSRTEEVVSVVGPDIVDAVFPVEQIKNCGYSSTLSLDCLALLALPEFQPGIQSITNAVNYGYTSYLANEYQKDAINALTEYNLQKRLELEKLGVNTKIASGLNDPVFATNPNHAGYYQPSTKSIVLRDDSVLYAESHEAIHATRDLTGMKQNLRESVYGVDISGYAKSEIISSLEEVGTISENLRLYDTIGGVPELMVQGEQAYLAQNSQRYLEALKSNYDDVTVSVFNQINKPSESPLSLIVNPDGDIIIPSANKIIPNVKPWEPILVPGNTYAPGSIVLP